MNTTYHAGLTFTPRDAARAARAQVEAALDAAGWPVAPAVSRWLDCLVQLEEAASSS